MLNLKRGFDRLFLVLTILWALYCALVFPFQQSATAFHQYQRETNSCYQAEGSINDMNSCADVVFENWRATTDRWTYKRYYHDTWWPLLLVIVIPPVVVYGLARGLAAVSIWVGRGLKTP
jgi:ABC-type spermidine/putrescine transport system permease subunit I